MSQFKLESHLSQVAAHLKQRASALVRKTAFGIEGAIKASMAEAKHGRTYKVSKTGRAHQASAPGEAPAIDTGALVNSIQTTAEGLNAVIGTNMEYAVHLEFGTVAMEPRPFFGPTFEHAQPAFEQGLRELLK